MAAPGVHQGLVITEHGPFVVSEDTRRTLPIGSSIDFAPWSREPPDGKRDGGAA
jgi:hypothetical protein